MSIDWEDVKSFGAGTINDMLFDLPEVIAKATGKNIFEEMRKRNPTAYEMGKTASIVGGLIPGGALIKGLKGLKTADTALDLAKGIKKFDIAADVARGIDKASDIARFGKKADTAIDIARGADTAMDLGKAAKSIDTAADTGRAINPKVKQLLENIDNAPSAVKKPNEIAKITQEEASKFIIDKPKLNAKQISELGQLSEYGLEGDYSDLAYDAKKVLDKAGIDKLDGYHIVNPNDINSVMKSGIKKSAWYNNPEGVYFLADPDDIELGYDYLNMKKTTEGREVLPLVHFTIPKEEIKKLQWDGRFNVTFGTYSSFLYKGDVKPEWIDSIKYIYTPAKEEIGTGRKVLLDPMEIIKQRVAKRIAQGGK